MSDANRNSTFDGCPPEWTYSVYVDRELEPEETRAVETHLVGCRACRELVVELEDEATALRAALLREERALERAPALPASRGLAISASSSVVTALVCLTTLGWLSQLPIPSWLGWLNPFDLTGVFSMLFDTISAFRTHAPAFYQFVLLSAALFSAAFLLTATFTFTSRRFLRSETAGLLLLGGLISFTLAAPLPAQAIELHFDDESVVVAEGEVVEQTWVSTARTVTIEGTLRGDLIAFGDRVVISGVLDGNLLGGARKIEIPGRVTGSVVTFGERVRIGGEVERNAYGASDQMTITEAGRVGRDLFGVGGGVLIAGAVGRDAMTMGSWTEVPGSIGNDLRITAENAEIAGDARIGGDVRVAYTEDESDIEIDSRAEIAGETTVERAEFEHPKTERDYTSWELYVVFLLSLAAAFLFGMVIFRLAPWVFAARIETGSDLFRSIAFGLLALVAAPLACVLVALTVIGIPVALVGLGLFGVSLYLSKIVVGGIIGTALLPPPEAADWRGFGLPLLAGLAIVWIASALPFLGGVLGFLAVLTGLGVLITRMQTRLNA